MRRLEMLKVKEVLRLKYEMGLSLREIGQACNCGKTTVSELLDRAEKVGISWPIELKDRELISLLYPPGSVRDKLAEPNMEYVFGEMKRKNVTLIILWEEYKEQHPDGIMYSQFRDRYHKLKKQNHLTLHKEHKAGEEVEVDWAGTTMSYVNPKTGEIMDAYIFVAVLPASNYPFVYAYENMRKENWIDAHIKAYEWFGGVPRITIPDNTKTAVSKPDTVDPVLNKSYHELAKHYRTTIIPARPRRPKDKASAENMVGNVSRRIIATLRNQQFFSLQEINNAIRNELKKFIVRPFQKMEGNRQTAFESIDKPCLQPLPNAKFEVPDWKEMNVPFNYHVEYDGFFYSVPYMHVNSRCSIRSTNKTVEVFVDCERITAHQRNYDKYNRYRTLPDHMPENHKAIYGWNKERFLSWAEKIGHTTRQYIAMILNSREYPVQTYRTCMGVIRLGDSGSEEVMESACGEAIEKNILSYKYFKIIYQKISKSAEEQVQETKVITHMNLRGRNSFEGGGIYAQ